MWQIGQTALHLAPDPSDCDTEDPLSTLNEVDYFILASAYPIGLEKSDNLEGLDVRDAFGFTKIQYRAQAPGRCSAKFRAPDYAKALPVTPEVPMYSEVLR